MERNITEILIRKLEKYPCLYASKNPEYLDKEKKGNALKIICADLRKYDVNINVQKVETKVRSLRSQYARELRYQQKILNEGKLDENFPPKLWCFNSLSFLREHTEIRKSCTPVEDVDQETSIKSAIKHVMTQIQHAPHAKRRQVALKFQTMMSNHISSAVIDDGCYEIPPSKFSPPESCNDEDVAFDDCINENDEADYVGFTNSMHNDPIDSNCEPTDVTEGDKVWTSNFPTINADNKCSEEDVKQSLYLAQTTYFQNQEMRAEEKHEWEKKQAAEKHERNMKLYETKLKILQVELEVKKKELNKSKN